MTCEPTPRVKHAGQRYTRAMTVAFGLYMTLVIAGAIAIRVLEPPQWALIVLALAPLAPALMMLRAYLIYTSALDEFQRRLQSQALIVAAAFVVFGSFAYGFLEEWANFPHLPLIWVFPVFAFTFGIAHFVIWRRYQ